MSPGVCRGAVRVATIEPMIISGDLALDREAHLAASSTLSARLAELDERRRAAEACVDALLSSWRGNAATHFASRWQEWDDAASDVVDALSALLGAVDLARGDVLATDSTAAAGTADLAGRLG
jgi:WXG100 family type VII secretion target